jgi:uncharacterized protein (TIGR04255 family)
MGTPLSKPPVYFTVVQVRFNALLKLSDYLPSIQENLRLAGFPDFASHKSVLLQVTMQEGQPTPVPVAHERFQFGTVDKTHSFLLDSESLTLQSTKYGQFESFSAMFMKGLSIVHDIVKLDYTERVGLRYLDRVTPQGKDDLALYLAPEVMGLSSKLPGEPLHAYSETLNKVDDVFLRTRVIIQDGGLGFPPDLVPGNMVVDSRFAEYVGVHAILDNDGSYEGREVFSGEVVHKRLYAIHDVIGAAFRAAATEYAFKAWS